MYRIDVPFVFDPFVLMSPMRLESAWIESGATVGELYHDQILQRKVMFMAFQLQLVQVLVPVITLVAVRGYGT